MGERPVCLGSVEWADHDWQRIVRRGYVVRIYCSRCGAVPTDMLNRPVVALSVTPVVDEMQNLVGPASDDLVKEWAERLTDRALAPEPPESADSAHEGEPLR